MILPDAGTLFVLLIRVTAIVGVAWMFARSRWCGSAAIRHVVWFSALVACLLVPIAGTWLPSIRLPVPPIEDITGPEASTPDLVAPAADAQVAAGEPAVGDIAMNGSSPDAVQGSRFRLPDMNWGVAFVALWMSGAVLRLSWLLLLHSRTRRLTNRARALNRHPALQPLVDRIAAALGIRRTVPVLATPEVRMPLAWGVFRPVILLPQEALRWSDERLRIVLIHELTHVRRWDYATSLLSELVCMLYWPTPLVWVARRRVRSEQERACDDRVLALGTSPVAYADHILAIARDFYGSRWDLEVVVTMAREVSLKGRIRAILDDGTDRRPLRSARGLAVPLTALGIYLPLAAIRGSEPVPAAAATPMEPPLAAEVTEPPSAAPGSQPTYLWIEAESGIPNRSAHSFGDLDASNAQYVFLSPDEAETGRVSVETKVPETGEYFIWARVAGRGRDVSGLRLAIDNGSTERRSVAPLDTGAGAGWRWLRMTVDAGGARDPVTGVLLPSGPHRFELAATGAEVRVDRLLVTSDAAYTPAARGPGSTGPAAYILIEGEKGLRKGRIRDGRDQHASGSAFVVFRSRRGTTPEGTIEFDFDVPESGRYLIWGRTFAGNEESNSFHVSLDGDREMIWDLPAADEGEEGLPWAWDPISARVTDERSMDPVAFDIERGSHVLRVRTREGGAHLDALLVTNDLENRPEGLWPEALPARPVRLELAAELARVSGSIALNSHSDDGQPYLSVGEKGRARSPGASGVAVFEFEAAETGLYSVWARTVAPSSDEDSFWIRVDGGDWTLWNGIPQSSEWNWAAVRDADADGRLLQLHLQPGPHTLEIAGREGGLRLGSLLVTNDPLFRPS